LHDETDADGEYDSDDGDGWFLEVTFGDAPS
jgi:hypothetical protein